MFVGVLTRRFANATFCCRTNTVVYVSSCGHEGPPTCVNLVWTTSASNSITFAN